MLNWGGAAYRALINPRFWSFSVFLAVSYLGWQWLLSKSHTNRRLGGTSGNRESLVSRVSPWPHTTTLRHFESLSDPYYTRCRADFFCGFFFQKKKHFHCLRPRGDGEKKKDIFWWCAAAVLFKKGSTSRGAWWSYTMSASDPRRIMGFCSMRGIKERPWVQ